MNMPFDYKILDSLIYDYKLQKRKMQIHEGVKIPNIDLDKLLTNFENDCRLNFDLISEDFNKIRSLEFDSSVIGSHFLKLFPSSREEDVSDKLAWFLDMEFILDADLRFKVQGMLLEMLNERLMIDHLGKEYVPILPPFKKVFEIIREHQLDSGKRPDILLLNHDISCVLAIEVKVSDKKYLKSNNDLVELANKYTSSNLWLLIKSEDYSNIREIEVSNEDGDDREDGFDNELEKNEKLHCPVLTWENLYACIRQLLNSGIVKDQISFRVISEIFLGAIEVSVLNVRPLNISQSLDSKRPSILQLSRLQEYLSFRKQYKG